MWPDETLWRYLDGELPAAEASALENAALKDPLLRARLDESRALKAAVGDGAPRPPPGFSRRVAAAAASAPLLAWDAEEARRFLRRALAAAVILAALGLLALAGRYGPELFGATPVYATDDPILRR